ncbi:hypothetical protein [Oceanicaulis sp.]|jgi:hypothetical protein|uniref:hypothetical protein n=1 Tax=Oceanicaulis sp. TaxID=1924941 RepID=UPI003F726377
MADIPMHEPNGAGGGFGGFHGDFGDDGDGEFQVSLEIEVTLDLETTELDSVAAVFADGLRERLNAWYQQEVAPADDLTPMIDHLTVELIEVRPGSVIARLRVSLGVWGGRAWKAMQALAVLITLTGAVPEGAPPTKTEAAAGFEVLVIKQCEITGEQMTGKKPVVTPMGPSDTKPVMKS